MNASGRSTLAQYCHIVSSMKPGECFMVDLRDLRDIPSFIHNDTTFEPAHRILENIMGSAYTHSLEIDAVRGIAIFRRHENTGERHYSSPDDEVRLARLRREREARAALEGGDNADQPNEKPRQP